jgi:NAD(P)-dependent dehydrogenase (short-subunit alcohol dehydrogenase family)
MSKIWYITGASRGFGLAWAKAALERGDKVAATARDTGTLHALVAAYGDAVLPVQLDVTIRAASIAALQRAHEHFGRLDVVVNNAGYGHFGLVEELSEADARQQIETNLFGALWTTQAAIPLMRAQGGGHLLQVSSTGGDVAAPGLGTYNASKWALEGMTEALVAEVSMFGIKTTLIEPGGHATDWSGASATTSSPLPPYQPTRDAMVARRVGATTANTDATAEAVFAVVDADQPPARLVLHSTALDTVSSTVEQRLQTWRGWETGSRSADGQPASA